MRTVSLVDEFKPSPKLKRIYWLYSLLYFIPAAVVCVIISVLSTLAGLTVALNCIAIPLIVVGIWIPRFYESAVFRIEEDHIYARFGVWWRKEERVPYNLVSEVRLRQGPLQRKLGLASVDVFTPATGTMRPEATLFQLPYDVGLEKLSLLRRKVGILTSSERRVIEEEILEELRRIRKLLEEKHS